MVQEQEAQGTITAQQLASMPYHAAIPGSCDKGGAKWIASTEAGTVTCLSDSLQIKGTTLITDPVPFVTFQGFNDTFPAQYSVSVEAFGFQDANQPVCADVVLSVYQLDMCHNGAWDILHTIVSQNPEIAYGMIAPQNDYMMTITLAGMQSSFKINGRTIATFNNTYNQTVVGGNDIILGINPSLSGYAVRYKNFVYTPLSPVP